MKGGAIAVLIAASMLSPMFVFAQRGAGAARGGAGWGGQAQSQVGVQERLRIHQPGTGMQTGTMDQKRDRKRDGTGVNCSGGPCAKTQTNDKTQKQTKTQTKAQTRQQNPQVPNK
jgi:hypothetical protein